MFAFHDRVNHDLSRLEIVQIYHRDARVGLVVDEKIIADVFAVFLGESRVVSVAPRDLFASDGAAF